MPGLCQSKELPMPLTNAQYLLLRQDITQDPAFADVPHDASGAMVVATAYNLNASPEFWVWRTSVPPEDYTGANSIVWTEVDQLTAGRARIFEWMTGLLTRPLNAADLNIRQGLADTFGASSQTRTNLQVILRRLATRAEALYATGTGTPASPGTLVFEGDLVWQDIMYAWGIWEFPT